MNLGRKSVFLSKALLLSFIFIFSCQVEKREDPFPDPKIPLELIDLAYGSDNRQKMDVYLPANRTKQNTKVLIWIHGGAWIDGDKREFRNFKPWFEAVQQDYAYISLNYRLFNAVTRANPFPSQEADIERALAFIRSKLQEWNVSEKVVLAGGSAGGHLSLLHSYKNNDGLIKVAVGIFPPTDLLTLGNGNPLIELLLRNMIGDPQIDRARYLNGSPINFIRPNSVPTAFFHGDRDDIVPIAQSYLLEERLRENGVPKAFKYYPGQGHGFSEVIYREIIQITEDFIRQHL